jgi:hypothetical protein
MDCSIIFSFLCFVVAEAIKGISKNKHTINNLGLIINSFFIKIDVRADLFQKGFTLLKRSQVGTLLAKTTKLKCQ